MAKKAEQHSPRFEYFKNQYEHNYITKATLRKWVKVGLKKPDQHIGMDKVDTGVLYFSPPGRALGLSLLGIGVETGVTHQHTHQRQQI